MARISPTEPPGQPPTAPEEEISGVSLQEFATAQFGRVTRALATCHLMQYDCLHIVVTRDDRNGYISALEHANDGDLDPLVAFTRRLHQRSILRAMSA